MKLRKLGMLLEEAEGFEEPDPSLEQYKTPASLAAEFLHMAYMSGDIEDLVVYDFGCGTGILSVGAALLGARAVVGFDIDATAIKAAEKNAGRMCPDADITFRWCDIQDIPRMIDEGQLEKADTVIMNPPFGAQEKGNDRPFLTAAVKAAEVTYSIHNKGSLRFIEKFIRPAVVTDCFVTSFPIRRTFDFHKKDKEIIDVEICRIVSGEAAEEFRQDETE
ncbi:50S ribosomal protein L11 methyltransferase [Methanosarcinaceae archaeon]|nr:50S ribosomal protein L11 methyltransferase [Methanosarcinaceae archaeon]MBQ3620917.1 50S ribosomal protein L11 methyltransferase [Methanosarcinaceae archaeon]